MTVGCGHATSNCTSRRCLADMLIKQKHFSQPQSESCNQTVHIPWIEYQTLSVDTKNLLLNSRLVAFIQWQDAELQWDTSVYPYDSVVLPVDKVWTPEIHVVNGIQTTMRHGSHDLLAYSNGTLVHEVIIDAQVICEINMFNYPFASDICPLAFETWSMDGCGTMLELGEVWGIDIPRGDWQTEDVYLLKDVVEPHFILVKLSIKHLNPFITLLLPSILIILADMVSFALPLGGGERNSFKVTLVLSFTMFLIILNELLPGDSHCSPIIRTHFCVCLVLLVFSMLVSMVLTRMAKDGKLNFCCFPKKSNSENIQAQDEEEIIPDISVIGLKTSEDTEILRKMLKLLEAYHYNVMESEKHQKLADRLDKAFCWFYSISAILYFCAMITVMVTYTCEVNHIEFWFNNEESEG
ncbi:5-hydroxytryptamine receptor 3A-like [Aulostomus maculatus]